MHPLKFHTQLFLFLFTWIIIPIFFLNNSALGMLNPDDIESILLTNMSVPSGHRESGSETYDAFDQALFQTVSISTTAGFTTTGFADWPLFLPVLLLFSSFIGGCAGSTGGGMKVIRILLLHRRKICRGSCRDRTGDLVRVKDT